MVTCLLHTRTLQTEATPKAAGGERSFLDDIKKVRYLIFWFLARFFGVICVTRTEPLIGYTWRRL